LVRALMVANRVGSYSPSFFRDQTGKELDLLWQEMMGGTPLPGALRTARNGQRCVEILSGGTAAVQTCRPGNIAQRWGKSTDADGSFVLMNGRSCLGISGLQGAGSLQLLPCAEGTQSATSWRQNGDGELFHLRSGLCLTAGGNGRSQSAPLELRPCTGESSQQFLLPY
jgi:hypothetical protein